MSSLIKSDWHLLHRIYREGKYVIPLRGLCPMRCIHSETIALHDLAKQPLQLLSYGVIIVEWSIWNGRKLIPTHSCVGSALLFKLYLRWKPHLPFPKFSGHRCHTTTRGASRQPKCPIAAVDCSPTVAPSPIPSVALCPSDT